MSVNVPPRRLSDSDFLATTIAALNAANLPTEQLCLEITEEAILDLGPDILRTLDQLRAIGVRIEVGDFGTAHAAMSYVRHMPLDFIKIDQSSAAGMGTENRDLAMVEATLALSHRLGSQSIAKGIETPAHWAQLRDLGRDHGQGSLFAGGVPDRFALLVQTGVLARVRCTEAHRGRDRSARNAVGPFNQRHSSRVRAASRLS